MHSMHRSCGCIPAAGIYAPSIHLPLRRSHGMPPAHAAKQQEQQQQQQQPQQPVAANYRELMQHYSTMTQSPTKQKAPRQSSTSTSGSGSSNSSSSKGSSKGVPRLKPTKQTSNPASSTGRKPGAGKEASAAHKGRTGRPVAATVGQQSSSAGATKPKQQGDSDSRRGSSSQDRQSSSSSKGLQQSSIPAAWSLPSNGRGFGRTPSASPAAAAAARLGPDVVKVFRFGVDAAAVAKAIEGCGWQGRVAVVDTLQQADLILAVKNTQGGKHRNLAQGEKAASNAGIPFVIVGRKMTAETLSKALLPHVAPTSKAAVEAAAAAAAAQAKAAENKAVADAFFRSAASWVGRRQQ